MEIPIYPLMKKEKLSLNEMMLNISFYKLYLIEITLASTDASNCWGYFGIADLSTEECINKDEKSYSISINSSLFDDYFPIKYVFVDSILTSSEITPRFGIERKDTFAQVNLDSIGDESYEVYLKVLGFMQDGRKYEWQLKHIIDNRKSVEN